VDTKRLAPLFTWQSFLLLSLVWICFGQVLDSYFLGDDIWQVAYIGQIASGNWHVLWHNFVGKFLDIPSASFYRPLVAVSMAIDFLIWKTNASGWFVTNLLLYSANILAVWLLARMLTSDWDEQQGSLAAFFSAAFFAVNPLHCEPVCWLAGRGDLICNLFFVLSVTLVVRGLALRSRLLVAGSLLLFWLALLAKEMAVVAPAVVATVGFVSRAGGERAAVSLSERLRAAFELSWIFWLSDAIYFAMRVCFLGTFTGGYTDTVGMLVQQSLVSRLLDWKNIYRLLFPFADSAIGPSLLEPFLLAICYASALFLAGRLPARLLVSLLVWCLVALIPVVPMWGLGADLEASRIYYFASVPAALFFGCLLAKARSRPLALAVFVVIIALSATSARAVAGNWTEAGRQVRAIGQRALELANAHPEKLVILPLPKERKGALMVTTAGMFLLLTAPPYQNKSYKEHFLVFDRIFTESDQFIDSSRLKACLVGQPNCGPYLWQGNHFEEIGLARVPSLVKPMEIDLTRQVTLASARTDGKSRALFKSKGGTLDVENLSPGDFFRIGPIEVDPLSVDFLELQLSLVPAAVKLPYAIAAWDAASAGDSAAPRAFATAYLSAAGRQTVLVPLSHSWRWYANAKIKEIFLELPPASRLSIDKICLVSARESAPLIALPGLTADPAGIYALGDGPIALEVDCSGIAGASGCQIEFSRANYFFDNFAVSNQTQAVAGTAFLNQVKGRLPISSRDLPGLGYHQVRCRALSSKGEPLAAFSEALTVRVKQAQR